MRRIAGTLVIFLTAAGFATAAYGQAAQDPPRRPSMSRTGPGAGAVNSPSVPAKAAARPTDAQIPDPIAAMDPLLKAWEQRSARLKSLDVPFTRLDKSPAWDEKVEYKGRACLQAPNLACLHFQKVIKEGKGDRIVEHERIVCTGKEIRQYDYATKQIFVFPLDKSARKRALQDGPLPFLFNMRADEAKARYSMQLLAQNDEAYVIGIAPRLDVDREVFSQALLQLSKKTYLPDRLLLIAPNQKDSQEYQFKSIVSDVAIRPELFQALNIAGWKVIDNPAPVSGSAPAQSAQRDPRPDPATGPVQPSPGGRPQMGARPAGSSRRNQ